MTHGVLGLSGEERDLIHSTHPLKENLTLGHWESLQVYNMQSSRLRSWVGGSSLPSVYLELRCHQDVPVGSGPPPGEGAMFRTRPMRGRGWGWASPGAAGHCGGHGGGGGVTEGRAQCQEGPYGEEVSDQFPHAQEQSPATTCPLGLCWTSGGCQMVPKLPLGHPTSLNWVGPAPWGPAG